MVTYDRNWMRLLDGGDAFVTLGDDEVMIVAQTENNEFIFIENSSETFTTLALPRVTVEKHELPEVAAKRELKATFGYHAMDMQHIGTLNPSLRYEDGQSNIYLTWQTHVFLARNLVHASLHADVILPVAIKEVAVDNVEESIVIGKLADSTTVAVLDLTRKHLHVQKHFNVLDAVIVSR